MSTAISKLVVQMDAENAKLHRKLEQSQNKLKSFSKSTNQSMKALKDFGKIGATAVTGVVAAVGYMTRNIIDSADRIDKLSASTGLASEELSFLSFSADLAGVGFEGLVKGVSKMQRSMYDAQDGLLTQKKAFDELGVSITDNNGNLRDTGDVLGDVADIFKGMEDGAKKAALAQVIFGKAGRDMIPFLNEGREGLEAQREEFEALGLAMDGDFTAAAAKVNDQLGMLSKAGVGIILRVLEPLMPKIVDTTKAMVEWAKEGDNVSEAVEGITNFGKGLLTTFYLVKGVLTAVALAGASLAAGIAAAVRGDFSQAMDIIQMGAEDSDKAWSDATSNIGKLWETAAKDVESKSVETGKKLASPVEEAAKAAKIAEERMTATMDKMRDKFAAGVKSAQKFAEEINKDFADRSQKLQQGDDEVAGGNVLDVSLLELQAKTLLKNGDIEGAADKARQAFDVLQQIKDAGLESNLVLEGMAAKLRAVGEEIGNEKIATVGAEIQFDLEAAKEQAKQVNDMMQSYIDANPLIQKIVLDQDGQVNALGAADGVGANTDITPNVDSKDQRQTDLTPVNITMPDGNVVPMYADPGVAERTQRDIALEALKRGRR